MGITTLLSMTVFLMLRRGLSAASARSGRVHQDATVDDRLSDARRREHARHLGRPPARWYAFSSRPSPFLRLIAELTGRR